MNVAIIGGTGFVGGYLVDALLNIGKQPLLLVRPGSESKIQRADECQLFEGDVDDDDAVLDLLEHADAVIYNIGILREFPARGTTFERLHQNAAQRTMDLAVESGVRRFLLMSANGVKEDGTGYQRTKFAAETYLQSLPLDWTIFRPSVLFGDPRGCMEFATQLKEDIIDMPIPAPLFYPGLNPFKAGKFEMAPAFVGDVAQAFVSALEQPTTYGKLYSLCGPDNLSWKTILRTIAQARGKKKLMVPAPTLGIRALATFLDRYEFFPITGEQIQMLLEGNTCSEDGFAQFNIDPIPFNVENLSYLPD